MSGVSPLQIGGHIISSAKEKAIALNNQFCSIFTLEDQSNIPSLGESSLPDIPDLALTITSIEKLLTAVI